MNSETTGVLASMGTAGPASRHQSERSQPNLVRFATVLEFPGAEAFHPSSTKLWGMRHGLAITLA